MVLKHVPKCFDIFAIVGYWLGLTGIIGFFFGVLSCTLGIYGIVFSSLGKRSINVEINKKIIYKKGEKNMKCKNCGCENEKNAKFCAFCGSELNQNDTVEEQTFEENVVIENSEATAEPHVPKCFDVFARLGFGLGLGGLICCILCGIGYIIAAPGIVFSVLGKKSTKYHKKASAGLVLSIIGTVLGFIIYVIFIAVLEIFY